MILAAPAPDLRSLVTSYTGYRIRGAPAGVHRGLPSRSLTVVLTIEGTVDIGGARRARGYGSYRALASGLHDDVVLIEHDGNQNGLQADLTPLGARALLGLPAGALAGSDRRPRRPARPCRRRTHRSAAGGTDLARAVRAPRLGVVPRRQSHRRPGGAGMGMAPAHRQRRRPTHRRARHRGGLEPTTPRPPVPARVRTQPETRGAGDPVRIRPSAACRIPALPGSPTSRPAVVTTIRHTSIGTGARSPACLPPRGSATSFHSSKTAPPTSGEADRMSETETEATPSGRPPAPTVWPGLSYVNVPDAIRFLVDAFGFVERSWCPENRRGRRRTCGARVARGRRRDARQRGRVRDEFSQRADRCRVGVRGDRFAGPGGGAGDGRGRGDRTSAPRRGLRFHAVSSPATPKATSGASARTAAPDRGPSRTTGGAPTAQGL